MSLNIPAVEELIVELRSGNYSQTKGKLHDEKGFCCLGVACEVAVKHGVIPPATPGETDFDNKTFYYGSARETALLPREVVKWFAFGDVNPSYGNNWFAGMNDNGASFDEIADVFQRWVDADKALSGPTVTSSRVQ